MLDQFTPCTKNKIAVVFGNEVKGVQQEVVSAADYCVEIPQKGTKHSFKYFCELWSGSMGFISKNTVTFIFLE